MAAVPDIKEVHAGQQTNVTRKSNNSKLFDADLVLEQADALLKNTGQYARALEEAGPLAWFLNARTRPFG